MNFTQPLKTSLTLCGYLLASASPLFKNQTARHRRWLSWSLPLAASLDVLENLLHLHLSAEPTTQLPALYLCAGLVASGKWLLIAIFTITAGLACMNNRRIKAK